MKKRNFAMMAVVAMLVVLTFAGCQPRYQIIPIPGGGDGGSSSTDVLTSTQQQKVRGALSALFDIVKKAVKDALKEYFREALPKVRIISQDELMGAKLADYLRRHIEIDICLSRNRDYKFLVSNWNEHYQKVAAMLFPGIPVREK